MKPFSPPGHVTQSDSQFLQSLLPLRYLVPSDVFRYHIALTRIYEGKLTSLCVAFFGCFGGYLRTSIRLHTLVRTISLAAHLTGMDILQKSTLSIAGRPKLYNDEVEVRIVSDTQLLSQSQRKPIAELLTKGITMLTNCRLIFITRDKRSNTEEGWEILLQSIKSVEDCSSYGIFRSTRLAILLHDGRELGIKFFGDEKNDFIKVIMDALTKSSWKRINMTHDSPPSETMTDPTTAAAATTKFSSSNAGINGILRKQEQDMESVENLKKAALSDLNGLMKSAREVVKVVQKYSMYLEERKTNAPGSETESVTGDTNEIEELLQSIGMVSPVTQLTAGRLYFQQLARQIVDIMLTGNRLAKLGGMISLPDLYCVINHARGTELLSPEDLYKACKMINTLGLQASFKSFPSGVMVLQLGSITSQSITDKIVEALSNNESEDIQQNRLNVSGAAILLGISVVVAKGILLEAERTMVLCRDESTDGLYFYLNRFNSWS